MERDEKNTNGISGGNETDINNRDMQAESKVANQKLNNDSEAETAGITPVENKPDSTEEVCGVDDEKGNAVPENNKGAENNEDTNAADGDSSINFVKPERVFKITIPQETEAEEKSELEAAAQKVTAKTKSGRPIRTIIYIASILTVSIMLSIFILYSISDYLGMFRSDVSVDITIPQHSSTQQIASILQKHGIIHSALIFTAYVKLTHQSGLEFGIYTLSSQLSYDEIVQALKSSSSSRATARVTIPEGYTIQDIGALLEKDNVCSKQDFINSVNNASLTFDFSSKIPNDPNRFYRLEGYIFPDTYEFYLHQSSDSVVKKMLQNFDVRFDSTLRKQAAVSGMTVDQIVTLASIIQKEASQVSEMGKVSSVFHNRLKYGVSGAKLLESDATILYVTHDIEPVLTASDTQLESAYNTYKHEGLPPGAICNPGLDAIKAAISPEKTDYYFFVTDENGNYYYAKTFSQHLINVKKALKSGKAAGTNVTE